MRLSGVFGRGGNAPCHPVAPRGGCICHSAYRTAPIVVAPAHKLPHLLRKHGVNRKREVCDITAGIRMR